MGDHERSIQAENDHMSMKTKRILTRFGLTFGVLRFDEKSFLIQYKVSHYNLLMIFMLIAQVYTQMKNLKV